VPLHVIDTAGLRESQDEVEQIGISRAWDAIGEADAVLFLHDLTRMTAAQYQADDAIIQRGMAEKLTKGIEIIDLWNKADAAAGVTQPSGLLLSAKTGQGLDLLRKRLLTLAGWQSAGEGMFTARARHVQALQAVIASLQAAQNHLSSQVPMLDLVAEELRLAQHSLGEITGEFTSDDLLGVIFSRFCIGK